jgi:hypothetical protein
MHTFIHEKFAHSIMIAVVIALAVSSAYAQPSAPPRHLDPINRSLWSDDDLGLRFTYPPVWEQATATQPSTKVVINWRLSNSKSLLASCYVEASARDASSLARAEPAQIHNDIESITQSIMSNFQTRASNTRLVEARATMQDGYPVIYLVREGTVENLDLNIHLKIYSIITSWRGREVSFECSTSIFGAEYVALDGGQMFVDQVEKGILHVMRTLQFDRD